MNLMVLNKIMGGAAAANGRGSGLCCANCCRKRSYCSDIAIKLAIAALVCIALCYACLVVETQRSDSSRAIAERQQQQLLKEKYTQIKDADDQYNDQQIDGSGEDEDGGILFEMRLVKQQNDAATYKPPPLLLFHSETNQASVESDENQQNGIKRFLPSASTEVADTNTNEWLPSEEFLIVKGEENVENQQNAIKRFLPPASTEVADTNNWLPSEEFLIVKGEENVENQQNAIKRFLPPASTEVADTNTNEWLPSEEFLIVKGEENVENQENAIKRFLPPASTEVAGTNTNAWLPSKEIIVFKGEENVENQQNANKRFLPPLPIPTASINASDFAAIADTNDWPPSKEIIVVKGDETETPSANLNDISKLVSTNDWIHHIPLQSADEDENDEEEGHLFDSAPQTIEWITASVESGERFFPQEFTFEAISNDDGSLTASVGAGSNDASAVGAHAQHSAEHFILTDHDNGDFMRVKAQTVIPLLPTLPPSPPPLPLSAFVTPPTTGLEGILGTLFGQMANIIRPAQQQQQIYQQQQDGSSNRVKKFNC